MLSIDHLHSRFLKTFVSLQNDFKVLELKTAESYASGLCFANEFLFSQAKNIRISKFMIQKSLLLNEKGRYWEPPIWKIATYLYSMKWRKLMKIVKERKRHTIVRIERRWKQSKERNLLWQGWHTTRWKWQKNSTQRQNIVHVKLHDKIVHSYFSEKGKEYNI